MTGIEISAVLIFGLACAIGGMFAGCTLRDRIWRSKGDHDYMNRMASGGKLYQVWCETDDAQWLQHDLGSWFNLSYASWLTLPRVLMEQMSDRWQRQMAKLLFEYDEMYPNQPNLNTYVLVSDPGTGRRVKTPEWLINYRRPDWGMIRQIRGIDHPKLSTVPKQNETVTGTLL